MTSDPHEAEFVGRGRRAIVAGLLDLFDRAQADRRPVWVSLEAPTGWGKTRIAREFYSALAQSRQTEPAYWPSAIATDHAKVSERRKAINPPDFEHVPMSRPDYLWWGIACGRRNGTATESLLQDVGVLRKHIDHLENAWWYRAGFVEKFAYPAFLALRAKVLEEGRTAVVDFGVTKAAEMVGGALPGFSAMSWLIRKGVAGTRAARARSKNLRSAEGIVYRPSEVDEVESFLTKIAPLVPVVLVVEDVHDADELLLDLLERLIRRDAPVMILTTGWPGFVDADPGLVRVMQSAGERLIRIDEESTTLPHPFPPEASLRALDTADLESIVHARHAQVGAATRDALVSTYRNPFALELVLETYGDPDDDVLEIDPRDLERLSGKVEDLYKTAWERLSDPDREALTLATLAIPAIVSADAGADRSWDREMLATALAQLGDDHGDRVTGRSVIDRAWVRTVDEIFCQFHDVAQMKLAANDFAKAPRRLQVRRALIEQAKDLIADRDAPAHRAAQAGRLLLAYRAELDDRESVDASRALLGVLGDLHQENRAIESLGDEALPRLDLRDQRDRELQWTFAQTQRQLGNPRRAIELLDELLSVEQDVYGPDASEVLGTRRSIASAMALDGRPQAAVAMLEAVLAQQLTTRAESDADVLDTRAELALALSESDRPSDAIQVTEDILATQANTLGSDSADLITTRGRLASALADSGRAAEALPLWEQVATALAARSGRDSPDALAARSSVARATEDSIGAQAAIGLFTEQLADERRVLGPDDPRVLTTRENLARSTDDAGDHAKAAALYQALADDKARLQI
ncbi:hypothetical protein GCM10017602_18200 [Herbiconiux flava]|nr:hypothetical protein GCM10017602_18200 [Herbiconiux flava]